VPHDDLGDAAVEAAHQLLRSAPTARSQVKRMINERYGHVDYETMFRAIEHSPELREGMRAFMEKRPPSWIPSDVPVPGPRI
jgi:enoyl-CoA hydratase